MHDVQTYSCAYQKYVVRFKYGELIILPGQLNRSLSSPAIITLQYLRVSLERVRSDRMGPLTTA